MTLVDIQRLPTQERPCALAYHEPWVAADRADSSQAQIQHDIQGTADRVPRVSSEPEPLREVALSDWRITDIQPIAIHSLEQPHLYTQEAVNDDQENVDANFSESMEHFGDTMPRASSLAAPSLMMLAQSEAMMVRPAKLTPGKEWLQLTRWSMQHPKRKLNVIYNKARGLDVSGLSKHAISAAFQGAQQRPLFRAIEEGLSLMPLNEIAPDCIHRARVNQNALKECARLGHLFGRLVAQNIQSKKVKHLKVDIKFAPQMYGALTLMRGQSKRNVRIFDAMIQAAKQPDQPHQLSLNRLLKAQPGHHSPLVVLNKVLDLRMDAVLLPSEHQQKAFWGRLSQKLFGTQTDSEQQQRTQQVLERLQLTLMLEDNNEATVIQALSEKFAPYLEMAKHFNEVTAELALSEMSVKYLQEICYSDFNLKQWFEQDEQAFEKAFKIEGYEEARKRYSHIDSQVKEAVTDFFKQNSEETARKFTHFVTASWVVTQDTPIEICLHGDETKDVPQAQTCSNQLHVFLGLCQPDMEGRTLFGRHLNLALSVYEDDPFGLK